MPASMILGGGERVGSVWADSGVSWGLHILCWGATDLPE